METQQVDAHVSLLSRMNAFYGIPNLSQETTAAVDQGAPAPEVYSPEEAQLLQTTEDVKGETTDPVEGFFTEATEQVKISDQAMALQQQAQAANELTQAESTANSAQTTEENQPELTTATPVNSLNSSPVPATSSNNKPAATSALNTGQPTVSPLDSNRAAAQPASEFSGQTGLINQAIAGANSNSNAGQPGALFSALG